MKNPAMSRRKRIILATFIGLFLGGMLVWWWPDPTDVVYQGKHLSCYLRNLQSKLPEKRGPAETAIRQLGTNALPFLCKMLQAQDSAFKRNGLGWLARSQIIKVHYPSWDYFDAVEMDTYKPAWNDWYFTADAEWQTCAQRAFQLLGPTARPAAAQLAQAFRQPHNTSYAGAALVAIGEEGLRAVLPALNSPEPWLRGEAAGACGTPAFPAELIPKLLPGLRDTNELVRLKTACALQQIGGKAPGLVIPALTEALRDPYPKVRQWAVRALAIYGTQAQSAVPMLEKLYLDKDPQVREATHQALMKIETEARIP